MSYRIFPRKPMMNSTQVSYFTLTAFYDLWRYRYLVLLILLCFYLVIICTNVLLILVICANRSLRQPMYMFLCSLLVNELYGSTGVFPFLMLQILSDVHTVRAPLCFLQIFCIYTYANVEFCNLAVMSYDRYLAICRPLQYNLQMTPSRMAFLIALVWLYPFIAILVLISLSVPLQLCGTAIHKVYCDNYSVVRLACSDTTANNVYGISYTFLTMCVVTSIIYSYIKILRVCISGSKQARQRAFGTCAPHLASLVNFSCGCFFKIIQNRFNVKRIPNALRVFLSLYWLTCQPLLSPLLYGLNLTNIHLLCKKLIFSQT